MKKLSNIAKIVTSRSSLIMVILALIFLFFRQCNETANLEKEAKREHNNYLAQLDSVRTIKSQNGQLIQERSTFQMKVSELSKEQKDLIKRLELNSNGRGSTPKSVIQTVGNYKDTSIKAQTKVTKDPNGNESLTFLYEPTLPGKNKLKISGKTPYKLKLSKDPKDSANYLATVSPETTNISIEQSIDIVTAIYQDPKSKRLMTRVTTDYPNLTFSDINSFEIVDNPETRKALKSARKEFGLGLQVGYGLSTSSAGLTPGVYVGFGLHYSPKFLQFGK
jgi:hypothetical protein